jgi:uncharacterized protein (DUF488 family)
MRTRSASGPGPVKTLFTIGHSTRPLPAFLALLSAHGVRQVVDVRTIPRSRRNPQFERDTLRAALRRARIGYRHLPSLGGLRRARKDSINLGWRNASFRGFADYMETPEFARGMRRLRQLAQRKPTAIMCAEAVPWRCHRSLIADALTVRKWGVLHIQSRRTAKPHEPTAFLRIRGGRLVYPVPRAPRAVLRRARPVPGASG